VPAEVVDAIGHLALGEISEVVETSAGYHVLQRLQVPAEQTLAAREISIRHTGVHSGWERPGRAVTRGQSEAEALASVVAGEAKKDPARFAELVAEHSDDLLVIDGGDCGTFSNLDFFTHGIVADALSEVPIGGVTGPIETLQGIKILQRTAPTESHWLVASQILVAHEGSSQKPGVDALRRSREQAQKLAERLLSRLREDPSIFDALQKEYSPAYAEARLWWQSGRGIPGLSRLASEATAGAVMPRVTETPHGFHVFRRDDLNAHPVDPTDPRLSRPVFELPRPPLPGLVAFLNDTPEERLSELIRQFRSEAIQEVGLTGEASASFSAVYERLIGDVPKLSAEAKALRIEEVGGQIAPLLSTAQLERFVVFRSRWIKEKLIPGR
jgi:hypothetical protein